MGITEINNFFLHFSIPIIFFVFLPLLNKKKMAKENQEKLFSPLWWRKRKRPQRNLFGVGHLRGALLLIPKQKELWNTLRMPPVA